MLDIKYIRENTGLVKKNCENRGVKADVDKLLKLDAERRELLQNIEQMRAQRNLKSKAKPTQEDIEKLQKLGDTIRVKEHELDLVAQEYDDILLTIPNLTHQDSPVGKEKDFAVVETILEPVKPDFAMKDHEILLEIGRASCKERV